MNNITIYEFDSLATAGDTGDDENLHCVPAQVYGWLEEQCLRAAEKGGAEWLRFARRRGRRAMQVTSFVGVIRAPDGFQIEVLPKVGKAIGGGKVEARQLLIEMLRCLQGFRHVETESAKILATRMPLFEVFIAEFLRTVEHIVKRGLRGEYSSKRDNLFALRGKLLITSHLRQNLFRADRFFTQYDEFSTDRPENRLVHAALRRVLALTASQANHQLARELEFVFADVPVATQPKEDFQRVRRDRGMAYYADALAWSRIILDEESPLTGAGGYRAPSLLFPMEAVFEAFVAKHLAKQLDGPLVLKTQVQSHYLTRHLDRDWFRLKPDLLIQEGDSDTVVLDTKWKLLNGSLANGKEKYGLAQNDFYQMHAYGQRYLKGKGDVVLIYPKTAEFSCPLPEFNFLGADGLRVWVVPFCLRHKKLSVPAHAQISEVFSMASGCC